MPLTMGVHAASDINLLIMRPETAFPCVQCPKAPPAGTADKTSTVLAKAPIRSRPPDRSVHAISGAGSADQSQGTKPVRPWARPGPRRGAGQSWMSDPAVTISDIRTHM